MSLIHKHVQTHTKSHTHPLPNAVVQTIIDHLHFLPENAIRAPAPDHGASLDCKHQQDDETNKHQEAQDDSYGLQEEQDLMSVGCNSTC